MANLLSNIINPIQQGVQRFVNPQIPQAQPMQRGESVSSYGGYQRPAAPPPQANLSQLGQMAAHFGNKLSGAFSGLQQPLARPTFSATNAPRPTAAPRLSSPAPTAAPQMTPPPQGLSRNPNFNQKPLSAQVQKAIMDAAKEFGLPHQLLFDIAWHEGGLRADAKNESPEGQKVGVPQGLFQFTPGTWNNDLNVYVSNPKSSLKNFKVNGQMPDRNDPVANARAAAYLIKMGQLAKWDASLPGWGQYYSDDEISQYYDQSPGHSKRRKG